MEGLAVMLFGDLFRLYTRISDKVVGLLLRARKHGLVAFEPEMLFQVRERMIPVQFMNAATNLDVRKSCGQKNAFPDLY